MRGSALRHVIVRRWPAWTAIVVTMWVMAICVYAQAPSAPKAEKKYQARPPATRPFGKEAFTASHDTTLRWTGNAGFLITSR